MNPPRRKPLKVLLMRCWQCAWHRNFCFCPRPGTLPRGGEKCRRFRAGRCQHRARAGPRYTGGPGSRYWDWHHAVEVYP